MRTSWTEPREAIPLAEYPRPQFQRASWTCLNGWWDFAVTATDEPPASYPGQIRVPYSPEAPLSEAHCTPAPGSRLWYRRRFSDQAEGGRLLLHIGAADQEAVVTVNGREAARHLGGYTAFSADLTPYLRPENELVIRVTDRGPASGCGWGKQRERRGGIWYTCQSGLWQTVWLERVPEAYLTDAELEPRPAEESLWITARTNAPGQVRLRWEGGEATFPAGQAFCLPVPHPRLWSPEDPALYPFTLTFREDTVTGYFAMRSVGVGRDTAGIPRLLLNGSPYFQAGLLDQGYWPDGLYTPPSDEAMVSDIRAAKALGFNMLRKHIKVEPMRWYYHCDRLGMLVWQDMVNGGDRYRPLVISAPLVTGIHLRDGAYRRFGRGDAAGRAQYLRELEEEVRQLRNVPSIVLWTPFNEGWGQFDALDAAKRIRALDPTRLIDHASGWHDQGGGDVKSLHVYFRRYGFRPDRLGRPVVLSEFGGYNLRVPGHTWNDRDFGYRRYESAEALGTALERLWTEELLPARRQGLSAVVYTQLTDVEDELNGLITYDRAQGKCPESLLRRLNLRLIQGDTAGESE